MNKKFIYYLLAIITFMIVLFGCMDVVLENDTFYTIKIGQFILNNGIDMKDHYSWIGGLPYTYPHWLFDVIVAVIYNLFSFRGIYFFTYILYGIVGICLYNSLNNISNNKLLSYILTLITIIIIKDYAACRAQIVSYSLIILFYSNLIKLTKTSEKKYIFYLFLISVLVVNVHVAVWPFLLLLFLPFFAESFIKYIVNKKNIKLDIFFDNYNFKLILITFIIVLLSGMLTPLGFVPYTYLFNTMSGVTQNFIGEHQPLILWEYKFLIFYIILLLLILNNKKIKLNDIFLLLGLTIMMLSSRRHRTLFVILSTFVFSKYFNYSKKCKLKKYKYFYKVVGIVSLVLLIWYPILELNKEKFNEEMISKQKYPVDAVLFIKNNLDYENMRIFNSYNFGSYLLFNDIKVYIDSRADLYTKEFNNKYDYFIEYQEIGSNYEDVFSKYNIDYALVYKDSAISLMLSNNSDFELVYEDDAFVIFIKKIKSVKLS